MPSPPGNRPQADLTSIVEGLAHAGVRFVLVGGLAAVAQGAPLLTFDVDIVHDRDPANVVALMRFLEAIHAHYRGVPDRIVPPSEAALAGAGHNLFMTDLGPLDALGAIEGGRSYDDLLARTVTVEVAGCPIAVLELEALVELKRTSTDPKDLRALAILEETLRRLRAG